MAALPKAPVARIAKSTGAARVSGDAVALLQEVMEDYALSIVYRANDYAHHAGRKTIKKDDIKLALK